MVYKASRNFDPPSNVRLGTLTGSTISPLDESVRRGIGDLRDRSSTEVDLGDMEFARIGVEVGEGEGEEKKTLDDNKDDEFLHDCDGTGGHICVASRVSGWSMRASPDRGELLINFGVGEPWTERACRSEVGSGETERTDAGYG